MFKRQGITESCFLLWWNKYDYYSGNEPYSPLSFLSHDNLNIIISFLCLFIATIFFS